MDEKENHKKGAVEDKVGGEGDQVLKDIDTFFEGISSSGLSSATNVVVVKSADGDYGITCLASLATIYQALSVTGMLDRSYAHELYSYIDTSSLSVLL